jgi:hypothetical protein
VVFRRLALVALLGFVLFVGLGLPARVTADAVPDDHTGRPCVEQIECAGAAVLTGSALLLVAPATGTAVFRPSPAAPVGIVPSPLRSTLLSTRLFRPPRAT